MGTTSAKLQTNIAVNQNNNENVYCETVTDICESVFLWSDDGILITISAQCIELYISYIL